jgi:hypothetical protein
MKKFGFISDEKETPEESSKPMRVNSKSKSNESREYSQFSMRSHVNKDEMKVLQSIISGISKGRNGLDKYNSQRTSMNQSGRSRVKSGITFDS